MRTLLVIDDDRSVRHFVERTFQASDIDVLAEPTAEAGLDAVRTRSPDAGTDLAGFVQDRLRSGSSALYAETLAMMERFVITRVLQETGGNQSKAAQILGLARVTLRERIATHGITLKRAVGIQPATD